MRARHSAARGVCARRCVTWAQQMKTTDRVSRKADDTMTSTER